MKTHITEILGQRRKPDQYVVATLQALRSEVINQRVLLKSLMRNPSGRDASDGVYFGINRKSSPLLFASSAIPRYKSAQKSDSSPSQRTGALIRALPTAKRQSTESTTVMLASYTLPIVQGLQEIFKATAVAISRDPVTGNRSTQMMKLFREFASLLQAYITALTPILVHAYLYLKVLMPKMMLVLDAVSLRSPLQLSIVFEDVLGRQHGLPFHYFRRWNTFKAMLENEFRNCPGEELVLRGDYRLMNARRYYSVLSPEN